jgi:protoheme ferro-lyase
VLLDLVRSNQIKREKFEGRYLYLSSNKARSTKQIAHRDKLSMQLRRIPDFVTQPMVIEILAEVIRQSKRHPRAEQVASALAIRGLPIAENDVMTVFDHYDIEKKLRIHIDSIFKKVH